MPGRDGTGPLSEGPMTGRGLGVCNASDTGRGLGIGRRCRCLRLTADTILGANKNTLQRQKKILQSQLEKIERRLQDD
jgi:hypothetical protein